MRFVWNKELPVFLIEVSIERLVKDGANVFRMEVPRNESADDLLGAHIAVIDPDGWRVEAEVVPNPTEFPSGAQHPGCIEIFLKPVAAHADYDPQAMKGKMVDGVWEPE